MIIDTERLRAWANQEAAQDRFDLARQNPPGSLSERGISDSTRQYEAIERRYDQRIRAIQDIEALQMALLAGLNEKI